MFFNKRKRTHSDYTITDIEIIEHGVRLFTSEDPKKFNHLCSYMNFLRTEFKSAPSPIALKFEILKKEHAVDIIASESDLKSILNCLPANKMADEQTILEQYPTIKFNY